MIWFIICEYDVEFEPGFGFTEDPLQDRFLETFGLLDLTNMRKMVVVTYFSFTSLSTVGLGDYHPRSNLERFVGAFILLIGVTLTSYITENLAIMIVKLQKINEGFSDESGLSFFFGTLQRFNKDIPLNKNLRR